MTQDEKKASEELLAGFDRPNRSPRPPRAQSRYVDFAGSAAEAASVEPRRGKDTALITRARRAGWLPWLGIALVLVATCTAVAWLAVRAPVATPQAQAPSAVPVPVPVPVTVVTVAPAPLPSASAAPPPVKSVTPRVAAPTPAPEPRVDIIRNL